MAIGHETLKLSRQSSNDRKLPNMIHITSLLMETLQFNHFPIISLWEFPVANQGAQPHNFSFFELSLPKQHLYKIRVILLQWFWRSWHLKKSFFFLNLMSPWQPNKMAIRHKTHTLGKQSYNDHDCRIWFTSLHWLWRKCNLTIFQL